VTNPARQSLNPDRSTMHKQSTMPRMDIVLLQQRHRRAKKETASPNYELIFLLVVVRQLADV
jgi:hypothetical protein